MTYSTIRTRIQVASHCITLEDIIHLDYNVNGSLRGCAVWCLYLPPIYLPFPQGTRRKVKPRWGGGPWQLSAQRQGQVLLWPW